MSKNSAVQKLKPKQLAFVENILDPAIETAGEAYSNAYGVTGAAARAAASRLLANVDVIAEIERRKKKNGNKKRQPLAKVKPSKTKRENGVLPLPENVAKHSEIIAEAPEAIENVNKLPPAECVTLRYTLETETPATSPAEPIILPRPLISSPVSKNPRTNREFEQLKQRLRSNMKGGTILTLLNKKDAAKS